MRCFFSLSSTSVAAPTLMTATPPASLARRSLSFSRSQSESEFSISRRICLIRASTSALAAGALDDRGVVLGDDDLAGLAQHVDGDVLELQADFLTDDGGAGEDGDVLEHGLAALAESGGLDGHRRERAADLVDHERGEGLALEVLGDDDERLARLHDLLQHGEQVVDGGDLLVGDEDVRILEDGLLAIGVGDEVRGDVALVELHALGERHVDAEGLAVLDGDDTLVADLGHGLGDLLADRACRRRSWRRRRRSSLCRWRRWARLISAMDSTTLATASSMPRFSSIGLAPAATLRRPSWTMAWASTVAVVVPSPATSLVLVATSLASWAPMFSYGSSSSISLAMVTPSLVMVGAPHFFSNTTLRPLGPRVTLTVSASLSTPASEAAAGLLVVLEFLCCHVALLLFGLSR